MKFTDPKRAFDTVQHMVEASAPRARNRARINQLFNGDPPYTDDEADQNSIFTNVNFLEGTEIMHKARGQFTNAFLKPGKFFTVKLDTGPLWRRGEWGQIITTHINRMMKRSPKYFQSLQNQFAGVVLHGVGPVMWFRDRDWCPKAYGIDDVFIPSGTYRDMSNLNYFAIYTTYTMAELLKATTGNNVDRGWNKPLVRACLKWLTEQTGKTGISNLETYQHPEKLEEDFKANAGFWGSDATPVLRCYDFYWYEDSGESTGWRRMTLLDQQSQQLSGTESNGQIKLFDGGSRSYGKEVSQIFQCQFADGAVVAPFRYHSVRSLGFLLYAVCHLQNRLRCKFTDAVFESMLWYFRGVTTGDEEKLQKVDLHHLGMIPEGLQWVPQNERHTVDPDMIGMALTLNRQLMSEHSSHYVQDVEKANQGNEQTATEVMAKVNNANAMIGSMLAEAYTYENYKQIEIARRFCSIKHPDAVRFRQLCMKDGVPPEVFSMPDAWDITTERTLGTGNKTLEIAQADRLMSIKDTAEVSPDSRRKIVRLFVSANTDDPNLASDLVPPEENQATPAAQMATLAWGTLIDAKPVVIAEAIHPIEYIQTLLQLLQLDIQRIEETGGAPAIDRVLGLANVIAHITERIQIIAVDENLKPLVKQFLDMLKNAGNMVKAYLQRAAEAGQQQQGDPEAAAKIQAMLIAAESKARIMEDNAQQKRRHAEMKFVQDENRKNEAAKAELQRKAVQTAADVKLQTAKAKVDIALNREKTEAEIEASKERTEAEIEAKDATTKAGIVRDNVAEANKPKPKPAKKK